LEVAEAYRAAAEAAPVEKNLLLGLARARYEAFLAAEPKHPEAARVRLMVTQLPEPVSASAFKADPKRLAILFDDEPGFVEKLTKGAQGGGTAVAEFCDRRMGRLSLKVTGMAHNANIDGWKFSIVENPVGPNEFRYFHFAFRPEKGAGVVVELARSGQFAVLPKTTADPAGDGKEWTFATRDLYKEFGAFTLTGIALKTSGPCWFDRLLLAKSHADIERYLGKKR
jgi:hypothetical protein